MKLKDIVKQIALNVFRAEIQTALPVLVRNALQEAFLDEAPAPVSVRMVASSKDASAAVDSAVTSARARRSSESLTSPSPARPAPTA